MKSNRVSTRGILVTLCADESRVGMPGRAAPQGKLTGIGVKPIGEVQWQLLYRWLYGVVELLSGEHFMLEMSHLDSLCFEAFLQTFAQTYPHQLHLIQVDTCLST
ncbi:MAG: hypothetical protein BRC41_01110 [Cyanobacteria bacterium QH_9_48_43]|nr:MAG: hypothetical protein BRC41_01110 [Cyanobacteria bacterium QH_9_48_43]PSO93066.1 MAG: hypothetical protein BRC53_15330 [Cyanobacteria bacterium SW_6_48_11]PSP10293.1 MAG: hypothetical protein BRC50_15290 [Cyanobacteria bacterium SW_11_48_12]